MCCTKGANIWAFLTNLTYKCKELVAAGVTVTNKDYECIVLHSIPEELAKFAAQLLSAAHLNRATTTDTDTLISHICEKAEHLRNRCTWDQLNKGGKKEGQTDEALAATGSEAGRKKCHKGKCHNCGKPGHWACKCRSQKKEEGASGQAAHSSSGTDSRPETKPVGSANIVVTNNTEGDSFWMAIEEVTHA